MSRHRYRRIVLIFMVGFASLIVTYRANASDTPTDGSVDRAGEAVVIRGVAIATFNATAVNDLFVYVSKSGVWTQIPFQVDEVRSNGKYAATEDGIFDANDEIAFMARDAGDQVIGALPTDEPMYEVEITNPLQPATKGWVYVVQSTTLSSNFTGDYVRFTAANKRIIGATYQAGFSTGDLWLDYLSLGSGPDILDRMLKLRACANSICLNETTNLLKGPTGLELVKDGAVRVIVAGNSGSNGVLGYQVLAYDTNATWNTSVEATGLPISSLRYSTDFSAEAVGSTFFNAVVPTGKRIDGVPDAVPATPVSNRWQVSTDNGTIVQTTDLAPVGGTPSNYYVDNAVITDPADTTTDKKHYGETGYTIASPKSVFTLRFNLYFLLGRAPNVSATYASYFNNPLATRLTPLNEPVSNTVYIPLIITQ